MYLVATSKGIYKITGKEEIELVCCEGESLSLIHISAASDVYKRQAHITDFAVYKNKIIASVEDGHLLVGDELSSLKPIKFFADSHNLLSKGNYLYITTADGLYVTQDLENFHVIEKGYFHGIEDLGELILAQVRSKRPLFLGKEYKWERLNLELPSPTFGVTAISKIDNENIVYSTSSLVEINLKKLEAKTLIKNLPMTRRVKVVDH
ncbi:hypothetical protein [Sulfolobus acidocaldarius]|uniref:hypothetical protein n=1 Tax=Sulfolobus acidocaldarius TaxID=2285 RepID=UPI0009BCE270|nr:hypothetical protein [Sulfolobus acidocaldarius]